MIPRNHVCVISWQFTMLLHSSSVFISWWTLKEFPLQIWCGLGDKFHVILTSHIPSPWSESELVCLLILNWGLFHHHCLTRHTKLETRWNLYKLTCLHHPKSDEGDLISIDTGDKVSSDIGDKVSSEPGDKKK